MSEVSVRGVKFSKGNPFVLIAGPCQLESAQHALDMAGTLKEMAGSLGIPFVYKTSFDKANRTHAAGKRGLGLQKAIDVFASIRRQIGVPLLTDVHEREQCAPIAEVVDILQIPAFLCRQTDLLVEAAKTGAAINLKKGQFLAPWDMKFAVEKIERAGNRRILITERGVCFGYNNLVVDMRSLIILAQETGYPVVFDATHSVQRPGGMGASTGGDRQFVVPLAKAAVAVGVEAVFMEVHQDPDNAPSDGPCMLKLRDVPALLEKLKALDAITKN